MIMSSHRMQLVLYVCTYFFSLELKEPYIYFATCYIFLSLPCGFSLFPIIFFSSIYLYSFYKPMIWFLIS